MMTMVPDLSLRFCACHFASRRHVCAVLRTFMRRSVADECKSHPMTVSNTGRVQGSSANPATTPTPSGASIEQEEQSSRRRPASAEALGMPPSRRQRLESPSSTSSLRLPTAQIAVSRPLQATHSTMTVNLPSIGQPGTSVEHEAKGKSATGSLVGGICAAGSSVPNPPLPATLAPRQSLQSRPTAPRTEAFPPATVDKARTFVTAVLNNAVTRLKTVADQNRDPALAGLPMVKLDAMVAPALIVAENRRNPGLNLVALHTSTSDDRTHRVARSYYRVRAVCATSGRHASCDAAVQSQVRRCVVLHGYGAGTAAQNLTYDGQIGGFGLQPHGRGLCGHPQTRSGADGPGH